MLQSKEKWLDSFPENSTSGVKTPKIGIWVVYFHWMNQYYSLAPLNDQAHRLTSRWFVYSGCFSDFLIYFYMFSNQEYDWYYVVFLIYEIGVYITYVIFSLWSIRLFVQDKSHLASTMIYFLGMLSNSRYASINRGRLVQYQNWIRPEWYGPGRNTWCETTLLILCNQISCR